MVSPYTCRECGAFIEARSIHPLVRKVGEKPWDQPLVLPRATAVPCGHVIPDAQVGEMNRTSITFPLL